MEDKNSVGLVYGLDNNDLGKALIEEATRLRKKANVDKAVTTVQAVMSSRDECIRQIKHFQDWIKIHDAQLEAIDKGEFSFDSNGKLIYSNPTLNVA